MTYPKGFVCRKEMCDCVLSFQCTLEDLKIVNYTPHCYFNKELKITMSRDVCKRIKEIVDEN